MIDKARAFITDNNLIPPGSRVIAALSGGSDSMALFNILLALKDELGFTLEAAHVNHGIRGKEADSDEAFVRDYCDNKGIKCHVLSADVKKKAADEKLSEEEAGRQVRYDFFASFGSDVLIATAHNLDDRVETFLFNFTRGSSLKGLCSIPVKRDNIIRPLINCTKEEIVNYCNSNSIPFVTDRTNSDITYARNRIRHNVVSELTKLNPGFLWAAGRCIDNINEDEAYLSVLAAEKIQSAKTGGGYDISFLSGMPDSLLRRAAAQIVFDYTGFRADSRIIDDIINAVRCGSSGEKIQIYGNCFLRIRAGLLEKVETPLSETCEIVLQPGDICFGEYNIRFEKTASLPDNSKKVNGLSNIMYFDSDKIIGKITVRTRKEGDTLSPASRGITKPLRKLQNEYHIPPEARDTLPVFEDEAGVIGACGCGVDKRVAVSTETENICSITVNAIYRRKTADYDI